jgi:small-conductance mechanosensitive channel
MVADIDRLSRSRIRILTVLAVSYFFLQFFSLSFMADWTGISDITLERLENIGLCVFLLMVIALSVFARKVMNIGGPVKAALHDELVKHNIGRSMQYAYKFLFLIAFVLFILNQSFIKMGIITTGEDVARIMITACLVIPYLRFAYLEAKHA